jgi:hypothetical protein
MPFSKVVSVISAHITRRHWPKREAMASQKDTPGQETQMARFGLKSALPVAFVLGLAAAVPVATMAQAQGSRDPASQRNLNDPANQRNLNDSNARFQEQGRPLNDPNNARGTNGAASQDQKSDKKDIK